MSLSEKNAKRIGGLVSAVIIGLAIGYSAQIRTPTRIHSLDIDGDGRRDLIVESSSVFPSSYSAFIQTENGQFVRDTVRSSYEISKLFK